MSKKQKPYYENRPIKRFRTIILYYKLPLIDLLSKEKSICLNCAFLICQREASESRSMLLQLRLKI